MTAVSTTPSTRHMSHAGKYEPRMSNEGAREQLVNSDDVSKNATFSNRRPLSLTAACLQFEKTTPRARRAHALAPKHRPLARRPASFGTPYHPESCAHRSCRLQALRRRLDSQLPIGHGPLVFAETRF